jgi:hypothetical protein
MEGGVGAFRVVCGRAVEWSATDWPDFIFECAIEPGERRMRSGRTASATHPVDGSLIDLHGLFSQLHGAM